METNTKNNTIYKPKLST